MIIILEGPDLAGKSTLAQELASRLNCPVIHHGPPRSDTPLLRQYSEELERYRPCMGQHLVFDRLQIGETIYGPLKRGKCELTQAQLAWFQLLLDCRGAVVFNVLPPLDTLLERFKARGEGFVTTEELTHVHGEYAKLHGTTSVHHTIMDTPDIEWMIGFAAMFEMASGTLTRYPWYSGSPSPGTLFVGDTPGTPVKGWHACQLPFTPTPGSCGEFLFRAVAQTGLPFFGMSNSHGVDLRGLWKTLYHPRVVALGNQASERLERAMVPHTKVQHPQYARRFRHKDLDLYGIEIEEAVMGRPSWRREWRKQAGDC